jgi:predicted transcriptional regulator
MLITAVHVLEGLEATEHATPSNAGAPETSEEAARWMGPNVAKLVGEVFREILTVHRQGNVGLTTDAIEQRLSRSHQTVSPRVTDLRDKGLIEESGQFGRTRSGRKAVLWRPTGRGIEMASLIKEWSW